MKDLIYKYFSARGLKWPNTWEAMAFAQTELAEAYEQLLADKGFVRNNPQNKPVHFDVSRFGEELGDAIMMLLVAGYVSGVDPLKELKGKLLDN